ncbi:MAG TPA: phosphatase PAP2 family protein [Candidatus Paceibacterota bacterium]
MQAFISYLSNFDYPIMHAVQSIGPSWEPVARFLSYGVGSYAVMAVVFFIALICIDKWRVAIELFVVTLVSFIVLSALKHFFAIERPFVIDPSLLSYDSPDSFAFPSGHALMSVVILGWIALRHPKSHVIAWGAASIIVLVGLSRIYLGVHYPSQVLAGWLFGILLLLIFRAIGQKLWSPYDKKLKKR